MQPLMLLLLFRAIQCNREYYICNNIQLSKPNRMQPHNDALCLRERESFQISQITSNESAECRHHPAVMSAGNYRPNVPQNTKHKHTQNTAQHLHTISPCGVQSHRRRTDTASSMFYYITHIGNCTKQPDSHAALCCADKPPHF